MHHSSTHLISSQVSSLRPRRQSSTAISLCWLGILVLGFLYLVYQVFEASSKITDFCQDHTAVQRLLHGVPVYASPVAQCIINEFDTHPPPTLLLIWPLGWLSLVPAATLWGLFSLAAYLVSGMLLLREVGWFSLQSLTLFVLGSILWWPFNDAENLQNWGQLTLLLLVGAWLLERRGHATWAGILLGLASLFRIWPAAFLVVALFYRRWQLIKSAAAFLTIVGIMSVMVLGWSTYASYLGPARANELTWLPTWGNISLPGTIIRFLVGFQYLNEVIPPLVQGVDLKQAALLGEITGALFLLATLVFLWHCRQRRQSEMIASLSGGLLTTILLLTFPITWNWGIITILLPIAIILLALRHHPRLPRWWYVLLIFGFLLLLAPELLLACSYWLILHSTGWLRDIGVILFGLPTYGLLLFALAQVLLLFWVSSPKLTPPANKTLVSQKKLANF